MYTRIDDNGDHWVPNNLIFFDDPLGQVMRFVHEDRGHEVGCNTCDWTASGDSLLDTTPSMYEHLRSHDIAVYMSSQGEALN